MPENAPIGTTYAEYAGCDDVTFELKVTANRADCLSHYGLAREVACLLVKPLKTIEPNNFFLIKDLPILPLRVLHGHLPILAYKIKNLVYITDASLIDDHVIDSMRGVECLVINALRIAKHPTHFNLQDCLEMIQLIQPRKSYIIHLSHQMGTHAAIIAILPENVALAIDGLTLDI